RPPSLRSFPPRRSSDLHPPVKARVRLLEEQMRLALHRRFGASRERTPVDQVPLLFNEAEALAAADTPEPELETITYCRRKPRGPDRKSTRLNSSHVKSS